jgi:hypothetical protein
MSSRTKNIYNLMLISFVAVAVFYAEYTYAARPPSSPSVNSRGQKQKGAPIPEPSAIKKDPLVYEETLLSEAARTPWRNLSPKEQYGEIVRGYFKPVILPKLILAPKVSTNLLLSVLNL